jgi:hypothetical protein
VLSEGRLGGLNLFYVVAAVMLQCECVASVEVCERVSKMFRQMSTSLSIYLFVYLSIYRSILNCLAG